MTAVPISCQSPPGDLFVPTLESERLVLRAPVLADAPAVAALANNRKIAEMTTSIPHPYGLADAEAWIAGTARNPGVTFAAFERKGGAFVGVCSYEWRGETIPEIGYWAGEPFWGRGYATEAVRAMIDHAFTATELEALAASCRVTNLASRRVLEKCGFQWTGAGLCRVRALGASVPSDRFRLDRRTWAALRAWGKTRLPVRRKAVRA
ncbi:MAG: GNAT family N-acetyltransferase [Bradyrhizobiaceae bacterium]|nr:GNAT family N-acetyltransferase [Bradyrhizobiaceae bacterium]